MAARSASLGRLSCRPWPGPNGGASWDPACAAPLARTSGSRSGCPGTPGRRRPAGGRSWTTASGPMAGDWRTSSAGPRSRSVEAIVEYEASLPPLPARAACPGRVPHEVCGNVYDYDVEQRPRRRLRPARNRDEPLSGHLGPSRGRPSSSTIRAGPMSSTRPRRPCRWSTSGPASATACRAPVGSAATGSSRSAIRCRPATPEPGGRAGPRSGPHHDPAEPHRVVSRRGLRAPVGRGVLADEQGRRGPPRPLPRARRRSHRAARRACDRGERSDTLLFGALSLDSYLARGPVLPGGGALNMAWHWRRLGLPFRLITRIGDDEADLFLDMLERHGIDADPAGRLVGPGPSASIDIVILPDRQPCMDHFVEWRVGRPEVHARRGDGDRPARSACTSSSSRA